jgi:hypothetical protein
MVTRARSPEFLAKKVNLRKNDMSEHTGFQIEIDGKLQTICDDIASAKQVAISLANGVSSMKVASVGPGATPSSAWCWDYTISDWVFSQNAVHAVAKRKDEQA